MTSASSVVNHPPANRTKRPGWSAKQIRVAAIAARAAGMNDQQRRNLLSTFGNRAVHEGAVTSKSPRLNNTDYEFYMAVCERECDGQLPGYGFCEWRDKADKPLQRMIRKAQTLADLLKRAGALHADYGLRGFVKRQCGKETDDLAALDHADLYKLIEGLKAFARNRRIRID